MVALGLVVVVVAAGIYLATRSTTTAGSPAFADAGGTGGTPEGAAYLTAGGAAVGSVLNGIASLYGASQRQAGGTSAGGVK